MRRLAMAIGILFLAVTVCTAEEPKAAPQTQAPEQQAATQPVAKQESPFKTTKEKASYAIGMAMARNMKAQGIELDADVFAQGFKDAVTGAKQAITDEEAQVAVTAFQTEMMAKKQEEMKRVGEEQKKKGEAFLAENKKKEGVKTTASGLQYKVIKEGEGKKPGANDKVKVNYRGALVDGTEFDSSYKRNQPITFPVSGVIKGWTEALQLMKTGSKYEIVIPSDLAYGEAGAGAVIPPNATLVFEVELLEVNPPEAKEADAKAAPKTTNQKGKTTKSSK